MIFSLVAVSGHCLWLYSCSRAHTHTKYTQEFRPMWDVHVAARLVENFIKFVLIKFVFAVAVSHPRTNENMRFWIIFRTACKEGTSEKINALLTIVWYGAARAHTKPLFSRDQPINSHSIRLFALSLFFVQSLHSFSLTHMESNAWNASKYVNVEHICYLSKISMVLLKQQSHFRFCYFCILIRKLLWATE